MDEDLNVAMDKSEGGVHTLEKYLLCDILITESKIYLTHFKLKKNPKIRLGNF